MQIFAYVAQSATAEMYVTQYHSLSFYVCLIIIVQGSQIQNVTLKLSIFSFLDFYVKNHACLLKIPFFDHFLGSEFIIQFYHYHPVVRDCSHFNYALI